MNPNETKGKVTLVLTSKAFIDFLGSNPELEVEVSRAAVNNYYNQFLKVRVSEEVSNRLEGAVDNAVELTKSEIKSKIRWSQKELTSVIDSRLKTIIKEYIDTELSKHMSRLFREFCDKYFGSENLTETVTHYTRVELKKELPKYMAEALADQAIKNKITELLEGMKIVPGV